MDNPSTILVFIMMVIVILLIAIQVLQRIPFITRLILRAIVLVIRFILRGIHYAAKQLHVRRQRLSAHAQSPVNTPAKPVRRGITPARAMPAKVSQPVPTRLDAKDQTRLMLEALPARTVYQPPQQLLTIPFMRDTKQWYSLRVAPDECAVICGARRMGKGNFLQLLALSLLAHDPERMHVWVLDLKGGMDYQFCRDMAHARLYADGDHSDGGLALGYLSVVREMRRREALITAARKRNIHEYNAVADVPLPYLAVICDEVADLPTSYPAGMLDNEPENILQCTVGGLEGTLRSLARLSGASGIILYVATQRPTRDVLDGQIQANTPNRIIFGLANDKDSAVAYSTTKPTLYDPSAIDRAGVAVFKTPTSEVIGVVPEMTDRVIDGIARTLADRYPRTETLYTLSDSDDDENEPLVSKFPSSQVPKFPSSQVPTLKNAENTAGTSGTQHEETKKLMRMMRDQGMEKTKICKALKGRYQDLLVIYDEAMGDESHGASLDTQ